MAKDHSHPEPKKCKHDLGWCEKCERPYCKTCGQEWYAKVETATGLSQWSDILQNQRKWPNQPIPAPSQPWDPRPQYTAPSLTPFFSPNTVLCQHAQNTQE